MTKQFKMKIPTEIANNFEKECEEISNSLMSFDVQKFADLCATWGAEYEYQESWAFIYDAWGSDHAYEYSNERRPKILALKEQAIKAFEHILSHSETQLGMETVLKALQSLPDDDT